MNHGITSLKPETLLPGPQAFTQSAKEIVTATAARLASFEISREGLSYWAGQVKLFSRAGIAAMAMAGIHLRALREFYFGPRTVGRPKRMEHSVPFPDWETMLADVAGITRPTGERWMKVADAVEAMAQAEGSDVISICQKLPWEWTHEENERLGKTVQRLTQDKTQRELLQSDFLSSLGYEAPERVNGSNNQHGANGGAVKKPASAHEKLEGLRCLARTEIFGHDSKDHRPKPGSPSFYMNRLVDLHLKGELSDHAAYSLTKKELADIYDLLVKPFTVAFRELAGL